MRKQIISSKYDADAIFVYSSKSDGRYSTVFRVFSYMMLYILNPNIGGNVSLYVWDETFIDLSDFNRTSISSSASHTHSYSWVTVQEATADQDGMEEYRCSCGDVREKSVIPANVVFVKGLYRVLKDAPQGGTAAFDSGRQYTISDYLIKKLAERSDVTTVITFQYQDQAYQMTIPAGTDYTQLLMDEDYFYGYFYFANAVGATIATF